MWMAFTDNRWANVDNFLTYFLGSTEIIIWCGANESSAGKWLVFRFDTIWRSVNVLESYCQGFHGPKNIYCYVRFTCISCGYSIPNLTVLNACWIQIVSL